jgi:hypothetical protein
LLVFLEITHYVVYLLCKYRTEHRKQRGAKNWLEHHIRAVNAWNARANNIVHGGPQHRDGPFNQYLDWLKQNTCLKLRVAIDQEYIEDLPSNPEDVFLEYDEITRSGRQPERGPFKDYIVSDDTHVTNLNSQLVL